MNGEQSKTQNNDVIPVMEFYWVRFKIIFAGKTSEQFVAHVFFCFSIQILNWYRGRIFYCNKNSQPAMSDLTF